MSSKIFTSAQAKIAVGQGLNGLSQVFFILYPSSKLNLSEFSYLSMWQSLAFGFGLVTSSTLSNITFSKALDTLHLRRKLNLRIYLESCLLLFTAGLSVSLVMLILAKAPMVHFLLAGLILNLISQAAASVQRSAFAAMGNWNALSLVSGIEGLIRFSLLLFCVWLGNLTILNLIAITLVAQICSILIIEKLYPSVNFLLKESVFIPGKSGEIKNILFLASSAILSLVNFNFSLAIVGAIHHAPNLISSLTVVLIAIRLPGTAVGPLLIPMIREVSVEYRVGGINVAKFTNSLKLWATFGGFIAVSTLYLFLAFKSTSTTNGLSLTGINPLLWLTIFVLGVLSIVDSTLGAFFNSISEQFKALLPYLFGVTFFTLSLILISMPLLNNVLAVILVTELIIVISQIFIATNIVKAGNG